MLCFCVANNSTDYITLLLVQFILPDASLASVIGVTIPAKVTKAPLWVRNKFHISHLQSTMEMNIGRVSKTYLRNQSIKEVIPQQS